MRFLPSKVFTRDGFSAGFSLGTGKIRFFYNWLFLYTATEFSRLVYFEEPNLVKMYTINTTAFDSLYTQACAGLSCVEAETRLYIGHYDSTGNRTCPARVANLLFVNSHLVDQAFPDPPTSTYAFAQGANASGACTTGTHQFCFRIETRSGFPGRISASIGSFNITNTGGVLLTVQVTVTTGDDAAFIHLGMTTIDNLAQYWDIPGAVLTAFTGVTHTYTFQISISDEDLAVLPTTSDLTDYFSLLTTTNGAPFPSKIIAFGNRNVYLDNTKAFISDPYNLQWLLDPDNVIQVEGQRRLICGGVFGGALLLCGPDWSFTLAGNNSSVPREWTPPQNVSDQIGTQCVNGIAPGGGYQFLWVAHTSGLYTFNGAYGSIPASYLFDPTWKRINWAAARSKLVMLDIASKRTLFILVPLDSSTECNAIIVVDYSRARVAGGVDPGQVDFVLDDYNGNSEVDFIGLIQDYTAKVNVLHRGMPNGVTLKEDPAVKTDNSLAIHSLYETGLVLNAAEQPKEFSKFNGMQAQIAGSGQLLITPYGLGKQQTSEDPVDPIQLEANPNGDVEAQWYMQSPNQSIVMETTGIGDNFTLSKLKAYYKPGGTGK